MRAVPGRPRRRSKIGRFSFTSKASDFLFGPQPDAHAGKGKNLNEFRGYHSEWDLGSPRGWDRQRLAQIAGKAMWRRICQIAPVAAELDFDHPLLIPVKAFVEMLVQTHRAREGRNSGLIVVAAERDPPGKVPENANLARHLNSIQGIYGALIAPGELELKWGRVCWRGQPVSIIFLAFDPGRLLDPGSKDDLRPLMQAIRERRVINPLGMTPLDSRSVFEAITGEYGNRFRPETIQRTPWTRRFCARNARGPEGEKIDDLVEWTRSRWDLLTLRPERGRSDREGTAGAATPDRDEAISRALQAGDFIVQMKPPSDLPLEDIPVMCAGEIALERSRTVLRCFMGQGGLFGFFAGFGGEREDEAPSCLGAQPLAVLRSEMRVREAVSRINDVLLSIDPADLADVEETERKAASAGAPDQPPPEPPIKIALRPRLVTISQMQAFQKYSSAIWTDCLQLERMWLSGSLDRIVQTTAQEIALARMQPWKGAPAIIATEGLFSLGAHPGPP